jgi:hypothetical protein
MGKLKVRFFDYNDSDIIVIKDKGQFMEIAVDGIWESDPFLADRIEEGRIPIAAVLRMNPEYMAYFEIGQGFDLADANVASAVIESLRRHSRPDTWWLAEEWGENAWPSCFVEKLSLYFDRRSIERYYDDQGVEFLDGITIYWQLK